MDISTGTGLEIGPLDSPIALKASQNVRYVDVLSTDRLRELFADDPIVDVDEIPQIDFSLHDANGNLHPLAEVVARDAPFDWVIASHVIEHVPDLIQWLADIAEVLTDDGHLVLVVPDKRYTFDVERPLTTVGQILQAHSMREAIPSERAVFDHFRSIVTVPAADLWAGPPAQALPRMYPLEAAVEQRRIAMESGTYIDSHVWMFTPAVLVDQIVELGLLELCDFTVQQIVATAHNELEFYAALRRIPRGLDLRQKVSERAVGLQTYVDQPTISGASGAEGTTTVASGAEDITAVTTGFLSADLSDLEWQVIQAKRRIMKSVRRLRYGAGSLRSGQSMGSPELR